jgi:Na+-driven multidrug efflux pump
MGNHGLWLAFCCFMVLRGLTLGLRLHHIEEAFPTPAPVSSI